MKKRIFTLALALVMCLALIPNVAFAAEDFTLWQTVTYFGKVWVIIGYNGQGVASAPGTLTLTLWDSKDEAGSNLYKTGNDTSGTSYRHDGRWTYYDSTEPYSNVYAGSDLQRAMDAAAATLSTNERAQIVSRDLEGGAVYKDSSDKVAGPSVKGALFWPLSHAEADKMDESARVFQSRYWLRSPGENNHYAATVMTKSNGDNYGYNVSGAAFAIRPACIIRLSPDI
jgi:hypothetical protein